MANFSSKAPQRALFIAWLLTVLALAAAFVVRGQSRHWVVLPPPVSNSAAITTC